jgi:capsular polysaccharide biosynthesis protein
MMDMWSLPIVLAWLRMKLGKIVLGGIVCALIAIPIALNKPKVYESSATLLVFPPTFKDSVKTPVSHEPEVQPDSIADMMSPALPVEVYKEIALSAPVIDGVIRKIPLQNASIRGVRSSLEVDLIKTSGRATPDGSTYGQVLIFRAKEQTAELAAKTAQTWAEIFKEQVDDAAAKRVKDTFSLLDTLHNDTKAELEQVELTLAEHKKLWNLDLIEAQLEAKRKQFTKFEKLVKTTEVDLASNEMKLKATADELAKEPRKEVYFRAPSDDAYWMAELQGGGKPTIEPDQGLRTEAPNKNYDTTRKAEVKAKGKVEGLRAEKDMIVLKLDELKKEIEELTATFADKSVERDKLVRESDSLNVSYEVVRAQCEKGRMADRTQASDIVIAGNAVTPYRPAGLSNTKLSLLAGLVGMLLTGGFLLMKEISEMVPLPGSGGLGALVARTSGPASDEPPVRPDPIAAEREDPERPTQPDEKP